MPVVQGIYVTTSGLQADLPSTAAEIASALGIPQSEVLAGMSFFCSDTNAFYMWNGAAMVQIGAEGFISPMLAAGDLIYEDPSLGAARLPVGTSGEVLTVVNGLPAWAATAQSTNFEANGSTLSSDSTVNFEGDGTYISVSNPSAGNVKSVLSISAVQSALASAFDAYGAAATAQSNAESFATSAVATETSRAEAAEGLLVPKTTTVNGHALSSSVTISASDLTTGTLPHGQLPTLVSGDIPNNVANTTGTAGGLSGSPSISITNLTVSGTTSFAAGSIAYAALSGTPTIPTSFAWNVEGNATGNLTLANAGYSSTFNQTSAVSWLWANTTIASAITTNASPLLELACNYWTGTASAADTWSIGSSLAAGTNGASTLTFTHAGSTGTPSIQIPALSVFEFAGASIVGLSTDLTHTGRSIAIGNGTAADRSGNLVCTGFRLYDQATPSLETFDFNVVSNGRMAFGSGNYFAWSSTTSAAGIVDTGISRLGAASLAIGNGTASDKTGTLSLSRIDAYSPDLAGGVSSAPTGIVAATVVVAVGAATATFTVSSTEGFTVGDTVTLSASGWTSGSGLASTTATVASVTSTTVLVLTYVSGGPWVAGTYTAQTGTLAQTGGTSVSVKYAVAYTSTPTVVVTPTSNAGAFYISASSTTGFTITYATSGTQTFNYIVMGNPS